MKVDVLDYGFVELIDKMGSDYRILESARVSTGSEPIKGDDKDRGLIRYMYRNQHVSPFEQCQFTFKVKAPIFVFRQWHRHRTQSYSEQSGRYTEFQPEFYKPVKWRLQSKTNHQGSQGELELFENEQVGYEYDYAMKDVYEFYNKLTDMGIAKELARNIIPVAQYSTMYVTIDLRNLFHFLELRLHAHAQYEIRVYAEAMLEILKSLPEFKWSVEIFEDELELSNIIQDLKNKYKMDYDKLKQKLREI